MADSLERRFGDPNNYSLEPRATGKDAIEAWRRAQAKTDYSKISTETAIRDEADGNGVWFDGPTREEAEIERVEG